MISKLLILLLIMLQPALGCNTDQSGNDSGGFVDTTAAGTHASDGRTDGSINGKTNGQTHGVNAGKTDGETEGIIAGKTAGDTDGDAALALESAGTVNRKSFTGNPQPSTAHVPVADTVADGVVHLQFRDDRGPWNIHVLQADLSRPGIEVRVAKASDGTGEQLFARERTSSMAARYNSSSSSQVAGAVNADFFNTTNGAPINLHVTDGRPLRRPAANPGRSAFILFADSTPDIRVPEMTIRLRHKDRVLAISGLNEPRLEDGLVLYNHYFGTSSRSNIYGSEVLLRLINEDMTGGRITLVADSVFRDRGNTTIHEGYFVLSGHGTASSEINRNVSAGDTVSVTYHYNSERNIIQAAGGMPKILCNGMDCVDQSAGKENVGDGFITTRHPRTAVGISEDGETIYLVTIDGRRSESVGMTLYEVAALMKDLGAWNALNLDGGGSTTMVKGTSVVNATSDLTGERAVSNAILILTRSTSSETGQTD